MKDLLRASGINKKSALLISLAKQHFPVETAEIESFHNEEYQKKREEIQKQLDKLNEPAPKEEEISIHENMYECILTAKEAVNQ